MFPSRNLSLLLFQFHLEKCSQPLRQWANLETSPLWCQCWYCAQEVLRTDEVVPMNADEKTNLCPFNSLQDHRLPPLDASAGRESLLRRHADISGPFWERREWKTSAVAKKTKNAAPLRSKRGLMKRRRLSWQNTADNRQTCTKVSEDGGSQKRLSSLWKQVAN